MIIEFDKMKEEVIPKFNGGEKELIKKCMQMKIIVL